MIRAFQEHDITAVMQIWLDTNLQAHSFIPKEYWTGHYETVQQQLPQAEVYVYEDDALRQIMGFIGLSGQYIAGIFVTAAAQSNGIGKQLLDYAKGLKPALQLSVYEKNARAAAFYQREGFLVQSEGMDGGVHEKELLMSWHP